jgi:hypothetical protein
MRISDEPEKGILHLRYTQGVEAMTVADTLIAYISKHPHAAHYTIQFDLVDIEDDEEGDISETEGGEKPWIHEE